MRLIKRRPRIGLLAPEDIGAGAPFRVGVIVDCSAAVPVERIDVVLSGLAVWFQQGRNGRERLEHVFVQDGAVVFAGGELEAGQHRYQAEFHLPTDAPSSHAGDRIRIEYRVRVRVHIPWWPDAWDEFELSVRGAQPEPRPPSPEVFVSDDQGPHDGRPYCEISLASTDLSPRGRFEGAIALANTEQNRYRQLVIRLLALEEHPDFLAGAVDEHFVTAWSVNLENARENQPIPFRTRLPAGLVPGFSVGPISLRWCLDFQVGIAWASDLHLRLPVTVGVDAGDTSSEVAPAIIGSERIEAVWQEAARRTGFEYRDGRLHQRLGEADLEIYRERGRRGTQVVGEVRFGDLGLGLSLERRRLRVRDAAQSGLLATELAAAVDTCGPTSASDRGFRCERSFGGTRLSPLLQLANELGELARAFEAARAKLPAPDALAGDLPAWDRAAGQLAARLDLPSLTLSGSREGVGFRLRPIWGAAGTPAGLLVEVRPPIAIDSRHHLEWREPAPLPANTDVAVGARAVSVNYERIQVTLPWQPLDVALGRLEKLIQSGQALAGRAAGVYR